MSRSAVVIAGKCNPQLVPSDLGFVLIDREHRRILKLNPVCGEVWKLLVAGDTEDQIVQKLISRYGVDKERANDDLQAFLARIAELHLFPTFTRRTRHCFARA